MTAQEARNVSDCNQETKRKREADFHKMFMNAIYNDITNASKSGEYRVDASLYITRKTKEFPLAVKKELIDAGYTIVEGLISWNI